jgi:hypothetical protein
VSTLGEFWARITPNQLKRILIAVLALALVPVAVAVVSQDGGSAGGSGGGWQSPASIFAGRSPGRREDGVMSWVKQRLAEVPRARTPNSMRERVLPGVRARPVPQPLQLALRPLGLLGEPSPIGLPPSESLGFAPMIPAFSAPGFDGLFNLPPSPGGGLSNGAGPLPPPGPAVPELATWLQMVVAIGVLGLVLRREPSIKRTLAGTSSAHPPSSGGRMTDEEQGAAPFCRRPQLRLSSKGRGKWSLGRLDDERFGAPSGRVRPPNGTGARLLSP